MRLLPLFLVATACWSGVSGQPPSGESLQMVLPPAIYAVADVPISVYFDNIVLTQTPGEYRFEVDCEIGQASDNRWTLVATNDDVGDHAFRVSVLTTEGELLESKSCLVRVAGAGAAVETGAHREPIRLLIIGDSLTNASAYPNEIGRLLARAGNPPWTMLGTHRPKSVAKDVAHEGYGGWTWSNFVTKYEPNPDVEPKKRSSPFVFLDKEGAPQLDMQRYFDEKCDRQRPDFVVILLGINDCFHAPVDDPSGIDARIDFMFGFADTLLKSIHAAAPKAQIGVCLTTPPNARQAAFEANYKDRYTRWGWKRIQHRLVQRQIDYMASKKGQRVSVVPTQLNLDPVDGYPVDNGVHPNSLGYQQIGATVFSWLQWELTK